MTDTEVHDKPARPAPPVRPGRPVPRPVVLPGRDMTKLPYGRLHEDGQKWGRKQVIIPADTPYETIISPEYWVRYAKDIRPLDVIECFCEDGTWEARLRVMSVERAAVHVAPVFHVKHDRSDEIEIETETMTHEVVYRGAQLKFCIVHKPTGRVVKDHLFPKDQAIYHLRDFERQFRT